MEDAKFAEEVAALTATAQTVTITEAHRERVGQFTKTLIVALPENFDAAVTAAPADVLVAGLQCAREWLTVGGGPSPDLDQLVRKQGTAVVLCLGDVDTNAEVWEETKKLSAHLTIIGAKSVTVMKTGVFSLELLLESRPEESRSDYLAGKMAEAGKLPGRKPKAAAEPVAERSTIAPVVDDALGLTYVPGPMGTKTVLMEAAVSRLRTFKCYDDLKDPRATQAVYLHDLQIVVMTEAGPRTYEVQGVLDTDLQNPRTYLNKVRGGTSIVVSPGQGTNQAIDAAIRAHNADLVLEAPVLRRTGWFKIDGVFGFVHPDGFNTADGRSQRAKSQLTANVACITIADTSTIARDKEVAAAKNTFEMMKELTDLNVWVGAWGAAMHTVAGLGVGCCPVVYGKKGSGKTTVVAGITGHLATEFDPDGRGMFVIDGSEKNTAKAGVGMDGLFMFIDDMRKRGSLKANESQSQAIEFVVRPAYAGGFARHAGNVYNASTKGWEPGVPDLSSPMLALVGEALPDGEDLDSTKERLYPVPITGNIFASGNSRRYEELATNGLPQIHLASFIGWLAGSIDEMGMDGWKKHWSGVRETIVEGRAAMPVSRRVKEVSSVPETGFRIWAAYLLSCGVITAHEARVLMDQAHEVVSATALTHGTENVQSNDVELHLSMLNSLGGAVVSNQARIRPANAEPQTEALSEFRNMRLLGVEVLGRSGNGPMLAMQPRDVLAILATEAKFRGLTERDLLKAFAPVALTDPGKSYKTLTVGGIRTRTLTIPMHLLRAGTSTTEGE